MAELIKLLFTKFMGESGSLVIIAPLPARELCEMPMIFTAETFAKMLDPQGKL
jgi:hypothetical protein